MCKYVYEYCIISSNSLEFIFYWSLLDDGLCEFVCICLAQEESRLSNKSVSCKHNVYNRSNDVSKVNGDMGSSIW